MMTGIRCRSMNRSTGTKLLNPISFGSPGGRRTVNNAGMSVDNLYYRAVVGCESDIKLTSASAHEDVYPTGSDSGLALDRQRPLTGVRSQALLTSLTLPGAAPAFQAIESAYPAAGIAQGHAGEHFCYARNVSAAWLNDEVAGIKRTGSFVAYLEQYAPETECVPAEFVKQGIVLGSSTGVPAPRGVCRWPNGTSGSGQIAGFGQPVTTLSGCVSAPADCICDSQLKCAPHTYVVGANDELCKGFALSCFCDCPQ